MRSVSPLDPGTHAVDIFEARNKLRNCTVHQVVDRLSPRPDVIPIKYPTSSSLELTQLDGPLLGAKKLRKVVRIEEATKVSRIFSQGGHPERQEEDEETQDAN